MLKNLNKYHTSSLLGVFRTSPDSQSGDLGGHNRDVHDMDNVHGAHIGNDERDKSHSLTQEGALIEPITIMSEMPHDPEPALENWLYHARLSEINDPTAAALATVDENYQPSLRMVLIRGWQGCRFVFYTNSESRKGRELNPSPKRPLIKASILWHFKSLRKQIRIEGIVSTATTQESDDYFMKRPRLNQLSAWASQQSRSMESVTALDQEVAKLHEQYKDKPIPRPPHWYGYAINAQRIELWSERPGRIHHRLVFERAATINTRATELKDIPWNKAQWLWP